MSYTPSIGDIVLVCQFAWTTYSNFHNATSEFKEIARDCKDIHRVLAQVDEQRKDRWSPMNRSSESKVAMLTCITECNTTLHLLSDRLQNYKSLGTATPKALERVRYITENFVPLRDRLRQDRDKINTQLNLGTNDVVGRIYQAILKIAADMRAGRRERTIIAGPNDDQEDTWTVITREMQLEDISSQDLEAHKAELEPYVQRLQREGAFDESALDGGDQEEIYPEDSITEVGSPISRLSFARQRPSSRTTSDLLSISHFGGVPIYEISYGTIFNRNITAKGVPRPDTFDVWELARLSWSLQRRCANGIPGIREDQEGALRNMVDHLTRQDPVLLILLADSSTKKSFWARMANMEPHWRNSRPFSSFSFLHVGRSALRRLKEIDEQVSLFQSRPNPAISAEVTQTQGSMLQMPSKRSIFSLRRSTSAKITSLFSAKASRIRPPNFRKIDDILSEAPGPEEWEEIVYDNSLGISHFWGCEQRMSKSQFEESLQAIDSSWRNKYRKAKAMQAPPTLLTAGNEDEGLLLKWLLSVQGLEGLPGNSLEALSNELVFAEEKAPSASEFRRQARLADARAAVLSAQDESGPLPSGWEKRRARDGGIYYLDHNTQTAQRDRPGIGVGSLTHPRSISSQPDRTASSSAPENSQLSSDLNSPTTRTARTVSLSLASGSSGARSRRRRGTLSGPQGHRQTRVEGATASQTHSEAGARIPSIATSDPASQELGQSAGAAAEAPPLDGSQTVVNLGAALVPNRSQESEITDSSGNEDGDEFFSADEA